MHTHRDTHTNTKNGYRQSKPHFVLTITPGLPLHGKGDQKDFSCLPFFLLFISPLFWSGTNSAASGANNAGSVWPP